MLSLAAVKDWSLMMARDGSVAEVVRHEGRGVREWRGYEEVEQTGWSGMGRFFRGRFWKSFLGEFGEPLMWKENGGCFDIRRFRLG